MTLATIPRYDPSNADVIGDHAVVVGASMAGLLTARVLADAFATVTVIDRDRMPTEPVARPGVPQSLHPHALLEAGRATIEDLLPGCAEDVISAGGVITDFAGDVRFHTRGGFLAPGPTRLETVSVSRPVFEHVVRQRVSDIDTVDIRSNCHCADYLLDGSGTTVEGVRIRQDGQDRELRADIVVDATGRASRTPAWLENHGYPSPVVDEVKIDMAYSTTFVQRPPDDRRTYLVPPSSPRTRGGMAAPVDGDRWIVNLQGVHGEQPPTDRDEFVEYAASLPVPELKQILEDHPWATTEIEYYPFPANRRHHYERLDRFPDGLLVVGDAIASFNPVYAQGMSVAALEALMLHHSLADGDESLASRFFERTSPTVDAAWNLAVGADFEFAQTEGPKPRGTAFFNWYLGRLLRGARADGVLTDAFVRVLMMERPPTTLLRPAILRRVLIPRWGLDRSEHDRLDRQQEQASSVGTR